jgi:hypothetical protein
MAKVPFVQQITLNGIDAEVLWEGEKYDLDQSGIKAERHYLIDYADREEFLEGLNGKVAVIGGNANASITRQIPYRYPENKNLYVSAATTRPYVAFKRDGSGAATNFDKCVVVASFTTWDLNFQESDGTNPYQKTFYTQEIDIGGQVLTKKKGTYVYESDGKVFEEDLGLIIPTITDSITWHQVPYLPLEILKSLIGTVNQDEFLIYPVGTLMFLGGRARRVATTDGVQAWEVTLRFSYRPNEWNQGLKPNGTWDFIKYPGTSTRPFRYGDFSYLDWSGF